MHQDREIWSGMLAHLRQEHATLCRQWFEEIEPLGIEGGVLQLRTHSNVHRDYLRRQCTDPFNDSLRTSSGSLLTVRFLGPEDEAGPPPAPPAAQPGEHASAKSGQWPTIQEQQQNTGYRDQLVLNPDYVFNNFVTGPETRLAHAAALAVASNPGRTYNPYFVHGDVGLGKTHLLQAICLRIREDNPNATIFYTSCEAFITRFIDDVQAGEMAQFRHAFRDVDVLAIDDVHFLAKRERSQEEFFHTFNALYQSHRQIILSSDAPPEEIPDLEDRLVSRFKWGLVSSVEPPCYETRVAILKQKAKMRGFNLTDEVACYVAGRIESNIRELEGCVTTLQMVADVEKSREIDLDLARTALGDGPARTDRQIQIQTIIGAVVDYYGVKVTDLQSKRRQRSIALPRQVCMYLARKHTRFSLEEIGGYFGGRDHTTVMHAVKTVELKSSEDDTFAGDLASLEQVIRNPM